jgi:hypothetical protein
MQQFLDDFNKEMHDALARLRDLKICDNLTRGERRARRRAINFLLAIKRMVLLEADKAWGLTSMDTAQYRVEGRAELQLMMMTMMVLLMSPEENTIA